jgi:hypothetical protein
MRPTYRGKEKDDAPALKIANVKRFSIMIRRYVDFTRSVACWC